MLLMFLALFASTSVIQVVQAEALAENTRNTRALYDSYEVQRGSIIASGAEIASSVPSDDVYSWQRVYVDGDMWAPVTGYINPVLDAATGIEQAMNQELSGTGGSQFLERIERIFTGQPPTRIQRRADAGCRGAACRLRRARRSAGRGHRDRAVHRAGPGDGDEPELRHESARVARHRRGAHGVRRPGRRPRASAVQSCDRRRSESARIDVQAGGRLGRSGLGPLHPRIDPAEPRLVSAAAVEHRDLQRERRRVRPGRHRHDRRRAATELQHPLRRARRRAGRHGHPRRGREVRLQRVVLDCRSNRRRRATRARSTNRRPRSRASARGR